MENKNTVQNKYLKLENTYANLPKKMFSIQNPNDISSPKLIIFNDSLADVLGLDADFFKGKDGIDILSGNKVLEGTTPISQSYAGHQFGYFTMLGDGRAVLLGEYISKDGQRFDIQLKGSGRTPYSRGGDGKAALGPMLREYIISEGMNGLGIPTTRSLAVVTTGESVIRETELEGAVLTRIAKSHIRVGTFQFAANYGSIEYVKALADYTLNRHFKKVSNSENQYLYLLNEVIKRQAELISKWQLVGFIHGVMNTDNMVISGETIDYGPCAFMDTYDPNTVFSSIDTYGRYAYGNQPKIAAWNLARFAETLLPLLDDDTDEAVKIAEKSLSRFEILYKNNWLSGMRKKLGLFNEEDKDEHIIETLLNLMKKYKADYTNTFLNLTLGNINNIEMFRKEDFKDWYKLWQERLKRQNESMEDSIELMKKNNPVVIPRNHRVEEALSAAVNNNNYTVMNKLLEAINSPYDYSNVSKYYSELPKPTNCPYKTYCGT